VQLLDHEATRRVGAALGSLLEAGHVVALVGDLGAGKTTLVKAAIASLGGVEEDDVASPTYVLACEYPGRVQVIHIDAYRLSGPHAFRDLDLPLGPERAAFVEWADRVGDALPTDRLTLHLSHHEGGRRLELSSGGERSASLELGLRACLDRAQGSAGGAP
jgi:tRNA threonylcarbamoyladenosine biosynthesis protein TsaE